MTEDIKKSVETAKRILKQGHCGGVDCLRDQCPLSCNNNNNNELCTSNRFFTGGGGIINGRLHPDHLQAFRDYIAKHEGEQEEVRYFFGITALDVIKFVNGKGEWIGINGNPCLSRFPIGLAVKLSKFIEVTERDLPYLKKPDVEKYGETEFRKVDGDSVVLRPSESYEGAPRTHGTFGHQHPKDYKRYNSILSGYRWCKPRKEGVETKGEAEVVLDRMRSEISELMREVNCRIEHGADSGGHLEYVEKRLGAIRAQHK